MQGEAEKVLYILYLHGVEQIGTTLTSLEGLEKKNNNIYESGSFNI